MDSIKSALDELMQSQHKLSEKLYQRAGASAGTTSGAEQGTAGDGGRGAAPDQDEVVDAEFEVGGEKGS